MSDNFNKYIVNNIKIKIKNIMVYRILQFLHTYYIGLY